MELVQNIYQQAKLLGACDKFKGNENLEQLIDLFKSVQGIEFCIGNHFPNLATFRLFKSFKVERYGIYIDAGQITLNEPKTAILIGRTSAVVNCKNLQRYEVVAMHGANVTINATNWAVVSVTADKGCMIVKNTSGNAMIL